MRIRFFFVLVSAWAVGGGFALQACGGSSDDTGTTTPDAAPEASAVDSSLKDSSTAPDVFDARPPCDPNKDILKEIPDAAIPDSSTTTGICLGCAQSKCTDEIKDCQSDCSRSATDLGCQDLAAKALECYAQKQNFLACGGDFIKAKNPTQGIGIALGTCVGNKCQAECGVDPDAGM